ncbi:hypothetical protein BDW22DRAFT_1361365 [Trametopsis cervina]|nr:hypothetical protein BDW22DRAFT_1361365 [Trametopsis cervina]
MLLALPDELILAVLFYADTRDRIHCSLVNRRLKRIADNSVMLQLHTECELADVTLRRGSAHITPTDILRALREYQDAWRTLRWSGEATLSMVTVNEVVVAGGDRGMFAQLLDTNEIRITLVPSRVRNLPECTWTLSNIPFLVGVFDIDAAQRLLIAVEISETGGDDGFALRLHSLDLYSGCAHTSASTPITFSVLRDYPRRLTIQIADDRVGIMAAFSGDGLPDDTGRFWVCSWKTGESVMAVRCESFGTLYGAQSFTFLSRRYILVPRYKWEGAWKDRLCELLVIDTERAPQTTTWGNLVPVVVLDFPAAKVAYCRDISLNIQASQPSFASKQDCDSDVLFTHGTHASMLMLYVSSRYPIFYRLFIPPASLLEILRTLVPTPLPLSVGIPWTQWSKEARLSKASPADETFSYYEHGSYASFLVHETRRSLNVIAKYDFPTTMQMLRERAMTSPLLTARQNSSDVEVLEVQYHLGNELLEADGIWNGLLSSAPYRKTIIFVETARPIDPSRHRLQCRITEDAILIRSEVPGSSWRMFYI